MYKLVALLCFLLALSWCSAQGTSTPRSRSAAQIGTYSATEFYLRKEQKEQELGHLIASYDSGSEVAREATRSKMLVVLYELFDLSMMKKKAEAGTTSPNPESDGTTPCLPSKKPTK